MELLALWRFHASTGGRVALRTAVPLVGLLAVAIGMSPSPGATLARLAGMTAALRPLPAFVLGLTMLALALAAGAVPRIAAGADGWIRSLPVGRAARRRGLALGIATAVAPLGLAAAAMVAAAGLGRSPWNFARLASLIVLTLGAAYAVLPGRRIVSAPLAVAGAGVSVSGGWVEVAIGALLVTAADLSVGDARRIPHAPAYGSRAGATSWRIALRASLPSLPGAWAASGMFLAAEALFLANNELPRSLESIGARLGMACALVVCLATVADQLSQRRPPWVWARSLPWTSRRRVTDDAWFLGATALPVIAAGALVDPGPAMTALLALPLAAARAAAAMRVEDDRRAAVTRSILVEGFLAALLFSRAPWIVLVALAATPLAIRAAARREASLRVSRWRPFAHLEPR